jgi:hypothetical protein
MFPHRREAMIRLGQLGLGAPTLAGLLAREQAAASSDSPQTQARAKSCILLFLWGGPPQQDMWDMKPDAPDGIRSPFQPIRTVVPGIDVCDQMPLLARQTDKVAVIRSVTHTSDVHEASVYHMLTGKPNPTLAMPRNYRRRTDFPNVASIVSFFTPPGPMPASVTIPQPVGHNGVIYAGTHAGFLGPRHDPMEQPVSRALDPLNETGIAGAATHPLALPSDMNAPRLADRRRLVNLIEAHDRRLQTAPATEGQAIFREQAFRMVSSPAARRAFDLNLEPSRLRERYGRNEYGESFLLARRLVEAGVRLVTVTWMYFPPNGGGVWNVWDIHLGLGIGGARTGFDLLKQPCCIPSLDRAYSALLEDLSQRGLLDETLVAVVGEFGRTPRINESGGRDHWGRCQTALLAGGGVRGGQVYGSTDRIAAFVKDNPVAPEDLLATIEHALGVPPEAEIRDQQGRPWRACEGTPIRSLFG